MGLKEPKRAEGRPHEWVASIGYGLLMADLWILHRDPLTSVAAHGVTNLAPALIVLTQGEWQPWQPLALPPGVLRTKSRPDQWLSRARTVPLARRTSPFVRDCRGSGHESWSEHHGP
jgi:hypothetical protein